MTASLVPGDEMRASGGPASGVLFDDAFLRRLAGLELVARRGLASALPGRHHPANRMGRGLEFVDHRAYAPGDDLRHLDWAIYARQGRPVVRVYRPDAELALYLLVDTSASMGFGAPTKLMAAVRLAAALAHLGLASLDRVAAYGMDETLGAGVPLARGAGQRRRVFEFLAGLKAAGRTRLDAAARALIGRRTEPGMVVLLSDFHDPAGVTPAIDRLRQHGFDPVVLELLANEEVTPDPTENGPVVLVDVESGDESPLVRDGAAIARYQARLHARRDALRRHCRARGLLHASVVPTSPLDAMMLPTLRLAGLLG